MTTMHPSAVILNGASDSGEFDITDQVITYVELPAAWTSAVVTIQAASKPTAAGGVYGPVYDAGGNEYTLTGAAASRRYILDTTITDGLSWIKLRSGTNASAVAQGADRTIVLGVRPQR